ELKYSFDLLAGQLTLGANGTYNFKYNIGAVVLEGVQLQPAGDYIGTRGSSGGSLPQWKASAFLEYTMGIHNIRWTAHHLSSMYDIRSNTNLTAFAGFAKGDPGSTVEAFTTHDLAYRLSLPSDLWVTAAVTNVFDKDPSLAR